jgi:O-antigen ligase
MASPLPALSARLARLEGWLDRQRPVGAAPLGWRCFQLGVFVLPASALFAALLLFVALVQGSRGRGGWRGWWADPANRLLAATGVLMLLGAVLVRAFPGYPPGLAWAGLFNWLPFFWGFWGFQPYVASAEARRRVALWLVAGTVPVLITGLGQLFLGWSGPWQILGGLVIWHLKAGGRPEGRLSGLFDYANITAAWLSLSWPLLLAALLSCGRRWRSAQRCSEPAAASASSEGWALLVVLALAVAQVAALVLTDSRNGWGALLLAVPIVAGPGSWLWLLPLLALALLPVLLASLPGIPPLLQDPLRNLVPQSIWGRLSDLNHQGERNLSSLRISQWSVAVGLIAERPWLGWGAAAFSVIYPLRTGTWHGHPHNLAIDLAVSHGLPAALLLVGFALALLIGTARWGMPAGPLFDRGWWAAVLVLVLLHASDIPMYDSRINIAGWILLAGLRCHGRPASPPVRLSGRSDPSHS